MSFFLSHSGNNLGTSQRMIPGTSKSAIITKTRENQITVHRTKDILLVDPQDLVGISSLVVNIGFSVTSSYHGHQPYETANEWQETILHILKTWKPEHYLVIRSGNPDILRTVITAEFVNDLRRQMSFDAYEDAYGELYFGKM